ncbi:hypothetical protein [Pseudonocardia phyllosphaerae]|uniref:hypothetical protein n=1 Tax=Pseudonocardia phyllosphaerae TaxID=3390502 RepID=UPI00397A111E
MLPPRPGPEDVAAAVLAHPSVLRLDGGPFGVIASYVPGRRIQGVRLGAYDGADTGDSGARDSGVQDPGAQDPGARHGEPDGGPVEVAVVVTLGRPFAEIADEVAARVRDVLGAPAAPVEVTVADVGGVDQHGDAPSAAESR